LFYLISDFSHVVLRKRLPYNLYCVGGDVKHCTIQSNHIEEVHVWPITVILNDTTEYTPPHIRLTSESDILLVFFNIIDITASKRAEHQSARMSKITNDPVWHRMLYVAVPIWQQWASKG